MIQRAAARALDLQMVLTTRLAQQAGFDFRRIAEGSDGREELLHQLRHARAHAGGVDADIGHPVALHALTDEFGLRGEVHAAELVAFQNQKLAALPQRRRHDHQAGAVAGLGGVVADPHGAVAVGPRGEGLVDIAPLVIQLSTMHGCRRRHAETRRG